MVQTNGTATLKNTGNYPNAVLWGDYNQNGITSIASANNAINVGVAGTSANTGIGGYFKGDRAPVLLEPGLSANRTGGSHSAGELFTQDDGTIWYYNGTAWVQLQGSGNSDVALPMILVPQVGPGGSVTSIGNNYFAWVTNPYYSSVSLINITIWGYVSTPFDTNNTPQLNLVYWNPGENWVFVNDVWTTGLTAGTWFSRTYTINSIATNAFGFAIRAVPIKGNPGQFSVYGMTLVVRKP